MSKDQIHKQIQEAVDSLEGKLKSQGFKDEDITELKLDLEVGIKNNANLMDLLKVIKNAEKKVTNNKKKSKNEIKNLINDSNQAPDYKVSKNELEETIDREEFEESDFVDDSKAQLENTIKVNSDYFSHKSSKEESNIAYMAQEEHEYKLGGNASQANVEQAMRHDREKEREDRQYKSSGRVRKEDLYESSSNNSNPSDVYR
jgi:hypothetical protein